MELRSVLALAVLSLVADILHAVQERTDFLFLGCLRSMALLRFLKRLLHLVEHADTLHAFLLQSVLGEATLVH
jgi:hypothetical protein